MNQTAPPPAWYDDPASAGSRLRWWNGYRWTERIAPKQQHAVTAQVPTLTDVGADGPVRARFAPAANEDFTRWHPDAGWEEVPIGGRPEPDQPRTVVASWAQRLAAAALDVVLYGAAALVAGAVAAELLAAATIAVIAPDAAGPTVTEVRWASTAAVAVHIVAATVAFVTVAALPAFHEGWANRSTLGKRIVGLLVVDDDGHPLTVGKAAGRRLTAGLLAAVPIVGLAAALSPMFTSDGVAWHDRLTHTRVVKPL